MSLHPRVPPFVPPHQNETLEAALARNIQEALSEDLGICDYTALLVADAPVTAQLIVREHAVLCGKDWFEGCIRALDPLAVLHWKFADGAEMQADQLVCTIESMSRALLSAERPALNLLQTLSSTATITRAYAQAIEGASPQASGCLVLDTRKTLPGLRLAQKYAVRVGGGSNQRLALWDGILIKENHIAAAGSIPLALEAARAVRAQSHAALSIQIEVETLAELEEALVAGADNILLDNFSVEGLRQAVAVNDLHAKAHLRPAAVLEASGSVDLQTIRAVAETGVDRISVGRLTKDIKAVDYSLRVV